MICWLTAVMRRASTQGRGCTGARNSPPLSSVTEFTCPSIRSQIADLSHPGPTPAVLEEKTRQETAGKQRVWLGPQGQERQSSARCPGNQLGYEVSGKYVAATIRESEASLSSGFSAVSCPGPMDKMHNMDRAAAQLYSHLRRTRVPIIPTQIKADAGSTPSKIISL